MMLMRGLAIGLAAGIPLLNGCDKRGSDFAPIPGTNAATSAAPAPVPGNPAMAKLVGKWQRGDGDYVIEVKSVDAAGKLDAAYFNPNPIHVSKAMAIPEAAGLKVFVELQDTGYPGCTYSLQYDAATDQLFGQYFQAAQQQTYDVAFGRLKE
jgi:hypothetical protein